MPAVIALALSVGVLAFIDTWLYIGPLDTTILHGLIWVSFVAWGCHFHSGGGIKGSTATVVCMSWGALVGMVAVMLANGPLGGLGTLAAPVAVGLGAALICLSSSIRFLATIPASVYGFAAIAGPILLISGMAKTPEKAIIPTVLSVIIGAAFGYVSEAVSNALTKRGGPSAEATADPEHS